MITPVILSGGSGTRLWPLSRKQHPKQFINLIGETSPFQETILRLPNEASNPLIICNEAHRFLAAEQLRNINIEPEAILLEPVGKNTGPAIALAALKLFKKNQDPILLVLPADHTIENINAFHETIKVAKPLAAKNNLIAFGVIPNKAETGYGYIKINNHSKNKYFEIQSFIEKPNLINAKKFLSDGNHLWNSGIYMFKASTYLKELEKYEPKILSICKKSLMAEHRDIDFLRINKNEFLKCPEISIDYAIMERTKNALVVKLDANWCDIGSWESLMNTRKKDTNGNVAEGDVILDDVKNTYALSSNRLITASGVSDLIIIDTQDALIVSNRKHGNNIKNIVSKLKKNARSEIEYHRKVYRPWGYYDSIDNGIGFQVKRILVNPGAKLSLQKHLLRAEHWVVVKGVATITCGKKTINLQSNQSTYIPKGELHRLENLQETPLEIIEIQTGEYLGEDDIIRFEDVYNRN
jgi:mannose-1-phosphate guanylyltransferase